MERIYTKKKIIILMIVICLTIINVSVSIFGVINLYEDRYKIESAVAMEIKTPSDLQSFASKVNSGTNFSGSTIKLMNDINCSSLSSFTPVGTSSNSFKGTFDGNGKAINGLMSVLFGYTSSAVIKSINFKECSSSSGALLIDNASGTTIDSIYMYDCSLNTNKSYGLKGTGTLIGDSSGNTTIKNCAINANIATANGTYYVGCFIGKNDGTATINSSYFRGVVEHKSRLHVYFGCLAGGSSSSVSASNNYVAITGGYVHVGKIERGNLGTQYGELKCWLLSANMTINNYNKVYISTSTTYSKFYYASGTHKTETGNLNDYLGAQDTDLLG